MKVLSQGKTAAEMWPYTATFLCWCGCKFKLEPGDKYRTESISSGDQREDGTWPHATCPNCGKDVMGDRRG